MRRIVLLGSLVIVCLATSCVATTAIAVTLAPSAPADSVARDVLKVVEGVVMRFGLQPDPGNTALYRCWGVRDVEEPQGRRTNLLVCGKPHLGELQLRLDQAMTQGLTARGDSLRRELLASLRASYGPDAVRECKWKNDRKPERSGCPK